MAFESKIVLGRPVASEPGAAHVFAYREPDDPMRLLVLLAERLRAASPPGSTAHKAAQLCLDPKAPWRSRMASLGTALHDAIDGGRAPVFILWDADALATDERESYDQERSSLFRRELFEVVRTSACQGNWVFVRTAALPGAEAAFETLDLAREATLDAGLTPSEVSLFAPECRPIAAWLVARHVVRPADLADIKDTVPASDDHLVDLAYQALPPHVRDSAGLLTALRAPQELNGHYGRLPFSTQVAVPSPDALPADVKLPLLESGLLQPTATGRYRMPRIVRQRLAAFAGLAQSDEAMTVHRREAVAGVHFGADAEVLVEAHYHAVCTGDLQLAKDTARYYGSELSEIARQISREAEDHVGSERRRRFEQAADLYEHILTSYDPTDAYAWEYKAYNLARARSGDSGEILSAYREAHRLRRGNPLYHGRLLGFRGQLGERIVEEAIAGIDQYASAEPEREALSFFAGAVFRGLKQGQQRQQAWEILARSGPVLRDLDPKKVPRDWLQ